MAHKYGKKASEKVERTMHEYKRGELRSGSGGKVTSRKQAIAIGLSQARARGYKVPPPPRGHATRRRSEDDLIEEMAAAYEAVQRTKRDPELRKRADQLDREIAELLSRGHRGRRSHATKYDRDDARMFGRDAYRMERTKAQSRSDARAEGVGEWQLDAVEEGWDAERRDTVHGGFPDTSHARRRASRKSPELKELELKREQLLRALGYAGNTPDQVRRYHDAIAEVDAKMRQLK